MGDKDFRPKHRVTIKSFQMAKTLVTNKQYNACVAAGVCTAAHYSDGTCYNGPAGAKGRLPASFKGNDQPVVCVDWNQAHAFSRWVGGRLPSEAEWEYAARSAGKKWDYPWGNEVATCSNAVIGDCGYTATAPACSKPSGNTKQGLCDMAGDAFEWVEDGFHLTYDAAPTDGSAWEATGPNRITRGGSWRRDEDIARSAHREFVSPLRADSLSFRPVR
ncbi:MAG: SUMF1/EgtB/PvdO family nonheme iron enzyme [Elusimicrobia bacterium]|nr:SUMF1/EgtB/PvdO family nonheme iron enzyme [Elusimicrobiota bacterium]